MQLRNQLTATQFVQSFDNPAPEVAGGSKVDLLSASGGTLRLSTLEELSLLGPSLVLGRLDPLTVKHNSRFIIKK